MDQVSRRIRIGRELLGARLREVRLDKGLTMLELAEAAQVHKTYVSKVEHGHRLPTLEVLDAFAMRLQVSVIDLLDGLYPWDSQTEPVGLSPVLDGRRKTSPRS